MNSILPGLSAPVAKGFRDGTHRTVSPAETVNRLEPLRKALGITRVANVTGLDVLGIPVVAVDRPNSRSLSVAQGKGPTLDAAKASGLMESIEFLHAERITLPLKLAAFHDLRFSHSVVDVDTLERPAGTLYDDQLRLLWIEGFDLICQEALWIPYELVHMDCTVPMPPGSGCFHLNSTGLASGNHVLEAINHAICEVIERDCYRQWNTLGEAGQRDTRVDPATVDDVRCVQVMAHFESAGFEVAIWDMTSSVQVPTFRALIWERDPPVTGAMGASSGMGCHASRDVALLRALTEAAQTRVTWISGARDDLFRKDFDTMRTRRDIPSDAPFHKNRGASDGGFRTLQGIPSQEFETFDEEAAWLLDRLKAAGIERAIVVDLTHPGLRIPVVRVTIPGLRHLGPAGTAPSRTNLHELIRETPA